MIIIILIISLFYHLVIMSNLGMSYKLTKKKLVWYKKKELNFYDDYLAKKTSKERSENSICRLNSKQEGKTKQ